MSRTTGHATVIPGALVGRQRAWIPVTTLSVPTVWLATADGLALLDLIAVELAVNGLRRGWTLTRDEKWFAARLMLDRKVPYATISTRVGASGSTLAEWFPGEIEPTVIRLDRGKKRRRKPTHSPLCGTRSGHRRHVRRRERVCQPCRDAKRMADRHYREHGTYVGAPKPAPAVAA
ncbi:hypothetical protein ACFW2X_06555 [Streptomyces antibioticus]|uniref:hypothetical protein n=1 Tax=Streptomyces antibioticus TaxID=1890 RepID=UPI0036B27784